MKRIGVLAVILLPLAGYLAVQAQQPQPAKPAEKTVTITESQLNQLVERRIAQRMLEEKTSLDQEVLKSEHWHTAIFEGVVYHVYTGPGKAMTVSWAPKPKPQTEPQPLTPPRTQSRTQPQTQPKVQPRTRPPTPPAKRP